MRSFGDDAEVRSEIAWKWEDHLGKRFGQFEARRLHSDRREQSIF